MSKKISGLVLNKALSQALRDLCKIQWQIQTPSQGGKGGGGGGMNKEYVID